MHKKIKKLVSCCMVVAMAVSLMSMSGLPATATRYGDVQGLPSGFWGIYGPYEDAIGSNNAAGIIEHGENIINFWLAGGTATQRAAEWITNVVEHGWEINNIFNYSREVASRYFDANDYVNAVRMYRVALAFVDPYIALFEHPDTPLTGNVTDMEFTRTIIENTIAAYDISDSDIGVYAEVRDGSGDTSYIGSRNEPRTGIYYGEPPGTAAVMDMSQKPGSTLIYVEYEFESLADRVENDLILNETLHGYPRSDYSAIQIAWNFHGEGDTLRSVPNDRTKITEAARYLKNLGIPVLLRVGAEMNVWEKAADPAEYKAAYRFISEIVKSEAPNVAMVWSVNLISAAGLTYEMFYPGDDAVDWIGISLYTSRYVRGNPNTLERDSVIYRTGAYANPVSFVRELVDEYGSRKPIIITEGGVSLYNRSNNEDLTQWALPRIRQVYSYIPMLFPQVKAIYWFNVNTEGPSRVDFGASPQARTLYGQLTASEYFLGRGRTESPITFKKLGTATMPANAVTLNTFAPYFTLDDISVRYSIGSRELGRSSDIPYRQAFNLSGEADGAHVLSIEVFSGNQKLNTLEFNLSKSGSNVTISTGSIPVTPSEPDPIPNPDPDVFTATPSPWKLNVNGGPMMETDMYSINGNNYLKIRDIAYLLNGTDKQFDIDVDGIYVFLLSGHAYRARGDEMTPNPHATETTTSATMNHFSLDGEILNLTAYMIAGSNYVKLRDVLELFNVYVGYDVPLREFYINTARAYENN